MVCHVVWIDLRRKGLRWNLPEGGGNHTGASVDFPLLSLVTGHLWWNHRYRPQWSCSPALMVFLVSNTFSFGTCAQYGEQHGAGFAPGWCWATCFAAVLLRRTKNLAELGRKAVVWSLIWLKQKFFYGDLKSGVWQQRWWLFSSLGTASWHQGLGFGPGHVYPGGKEWGSTWCWEKRQGMTPRFLSFLAVSCT